MVADTRLDAGAPMVIKIEVFRPLIGPAPDVEEPRRLEIYEP
jgi:hypothetical protein